MKYDTRLYLDKREISIETPTYFIADIAANHDGELERAVSLIWSAKEAGADCAKFQHFLAKDIVSDRGFKVLDAGVSSHQSKWDKSVVEVYEQYHCPRDWTETLVATCKEADIDFMTTPYDFAAIDELDPYLSAYKVGSGDISWTEELTYIAKKNKPVLLATGAADMTDVSRAVDAILAHNRQIVLMQCNTNYTGDLENFRYVNLNVLKTFADRWPDMVLGLSDHTPHHAAVLGAVALGARVIEKHYTDDNHRTGPDHGFAMNPTSWREMVDRTRELEYALGDGVKRVEENERNTVIVQRRAIRVREDLQKGLVLVRDHLEMLRPCPTDGIAPYDIDQVVGRTLAVDKVAGDHIQWADLV